MFDNDNLCETPQQPYSMSKIHKQTTPFHLSKQQSISEIAPDTQRSNNCIINLRGSLENIYGLMEEGGHHLYAAGQTADNLMVRVPQNLGEEDMTQSVLQQSARSSYALNPNQLMTNMINPIGNTTTDFYTEDRAFAMGTHRMVNEAGPHITDFEDHASQSPFLNKHYGGQGPYFHHQRDLSAHIMLDQMLGNPKSQQYQLQRPSFLTARGGATVFLDDQSQNLDTNLTQYMDENDEEYSPTIGCVNLMVWGRNQSGQLGLDPQAHSVIKQPILVPNLERIFGRGLYEVKQVSCGKAHTCLLIERDSKYTNIYSLGSNNKGQLGVGKHIHQSVEPISICENVAFYKLACAKNSTFAISGDGNLYSWGSNKDGLLGLASSSDQFLPQVISFGESKVKFVSAGKDHAFALVQEKSAVVQHEFETTLFSWGSNKYGQLGSGTYQSRSRPEEVQIKPGNGNESCETLTVSVKNLQPANVSCGDKFTIVQTQNGCLFSSGANIQGQLGLEVGTVSSKVNRFTKIRFHPVDEEILEISSTEFTACLMRSGNLYLWGPTPLGKFNEPVMLQELCKQKDKDNSGRLIIKAVSLGGNFGVIQDHQNQCYQLGSLFHENNKQQYDSNTSAAQQLNISQNIQPFKGGPLTLDGFACGHDFVVTAVSSQNVQSEQLRRFLIQNQGRKQNTSRSIGAPQGANGLGLRRDLQHEFNIIKQNSNGIYGAQQIPAGRYAANPHQQSICSSLSPLRKSLMQSDVQSHFNRRNDYLNRSAIISTQNNNQLQTLNTLRESVTPVKEFAPPVNLVTIEQSFNQARQVDVLYHTSQAKNDESFPQASNYSTLQDDRTNHQTKSAYNTGHLDHTPTKQVPPAHNLPLQLTSSLTSNQLLSNRGGGNIEYIDVLIKEKQELQHSLNIEIQRRLLLEREVQTSMNGVLEEKQRLCKQLESLKGELEKAKSQRNQSSTEKEASLEALRLVQIQFIAAKQEIDQQNAKINAIQQENEVLKLQITSSSTQTEQSKKEFSSIEESLTKKTKEIYELTVQLGCLKEENNQYKLEQEELKQQFQERINEVKSRAENDYQSLLQDYQTFQQQCKIESDTVDTLRRQCEESAGKLKDQEEKIRRLQAMNEKLRSTSRIKKQSQFKLEQPSTQQLENDPPISSHYTSVGGNEKQKPQSQEHSFQSIGSKRSKGASAHIRASQKIEKENDAQKVIMETLEPKIVEADKVLKKTQHQQLVSHTNNLFKKQHQPILQTISAEGVSNRQNTNRDQGCLQVPPSRKKSAGVPSTVKTSLAFGSGVLKSNNSRINATNQPSATTLQAKALNPKEKTPTRPLVRSDLSHQHLLQPSVNKTTRPSQSNLSKSPAAISHQTSQMQKSPQLQPKPTPKLLQKPSQVMSAVSSQQTFQLNSNEDSIFDPKVLQLNEGTAPDHRRSQQSFTLLQRNPHQEVTLGGIQCDDSSSPDTPQIAPGMILHQHEKPTAYVMIQRNAHGTERLATANYTPMFYPARCLQLYAKSANRARLILVAGVQAA